MKITRRQLRRIIKETLEGQQKDYRRVWDKKWSSSPDWQSLEDGLIALGRQDVADMLVSISDLGGTRYTFPKIQAAMESGDHDTLDKIVEKHLSASRRQAKPKWGRY